ncbi:unnamed protein product, partial [Discosporangium mesarthrocarpum]
PLQEVGTTLLVAPDCLPDFPDFHDFASRLEDTIEDDETLGDSVMVACFHPMHTFAGLEPGDVLNYEKRSPYPVINLLRTAMVDKYIDAGKTLGIAKHNEKRLRTEGKDDVNAAFRALMDME